MVEFKPSKSLLEAIREARTAKLAKDTAKQTAQVNTRQAQAIVNDPLKKFFEQLPTPAKAIKQVRKEEKKPFVAPQIKEQPTISPSADPRQQLNLRDIAVKKDFPLNPKSGLIRRERPSDPLSNLVNALGNLLGGFRN
jgi:hypothetical protein